MTAAERGDAEVARPSARGSRPLERELDRQLGVLLERGYAEAAELTPQAFRELVEPLRPLLAAIDVRAPVPLVLVARRSLVSPPLR